MARAMPMKKAMPFGGAKMPAMGKPKTMKAFEKSPFDKEAKGAKEGSKKEMAADKKLFAKVRAKK